MSLEKAVAAKLAAQRGQEEAALLWKKLWAAYEKGGVEGAQAALSKLLDDPTDDETAEDA
jgi:hypothetical protein